ncbi:MAG: DNA (cytosine-5-)-methyltransferase [Kiritimatiellia bacterium]
MKSTDACSHVAGRKLRTLCLFSGCGGLDLGFEQSGGFEIVAANEFWTPAANTYRLNHPKTILVTGDISTKETKREIIDQFSKAPCEAVIGGFPCQSNSVAGKRDVHDPRGKFYEDYINVVRRLNPRPLVVVMENVLGILTMARPDGQTVTGWITKALRRLGYVVGYFRLVAADFGVPQTRERIFILAWRLGGIPNITPTHNEHGRNGLPPWQTFRNGVKGLPESPKDFQHFPEKHLRFLKLLTAGQNWHHLPDDLKAEAMGKLIDWGEGGTGCFRRLSWDNPAPTLTCSPIQKMTTLCHPCEDRPLSVQEYMRCQNFPDDYRMSGSVNSKYKQLGNAVPVGLAKAVALAVRQALPLDPSIEDVYEDDVTKPLLSNHVSKKGPNVFAWSIAMPGNKCPFKSSICAKYCYANRDRFLWNTRCYERNLRATKRDDFVDRICSELLVASRKEQGNGVACAIHEKGDFHSLRYLDDWHEIMRRMRAYPSVTFFVYTRAWVNAAFLEGLQRMGAEPNVQINLSTDREMLAEHGIPERIGNGLITFLAETDDDIPAIPIDLVFRNLCKKPKSALEHIGGCLVCPHESNMYVDIAGDQPVLQHGRTIRIRCQSCRLCLGHSIGQWESAKSNYAGKPYVAIPANQVTPIREPSHPAVTVSV